MKITQLITATIVALSAVSAQADLITIVSESLRTNGKQIPGQVAVTTIDEKNKSIKMEIFEDVCGTLLPNGGDPRCLAVATKIAQLTAHNITKKNDGCGSVVYSGKNLIPEGATDFPVQTIKVTDNTERLCENVILALYVVQATTTGGNEFPMGPRTYEAIANSATRQSQGNVLTVPNDKELWNVLKVKAVGANGGIGVSRLVKKIGGLVCVAETAIVPGAKQMVECTINGNLEGTILSKNAEAIYSALKVKEQLIQAGIGAVVKAKTVGRLTCTQTKVIAPNVKATTECNLYSMFAL